ncbi:hypothetical protein SLA2020_070230 [Shorea laevis]
MATEKKPRRPPCRRQKYHGAPIGVNFRQHLLQRAMNTTPLWRVRAGTAVMEEKMKRVKKSNEKKRVELSEMDAMLPQLMAKRMHALEERRHALRERVWTQACFDVVEALFSAA